MGQEEWLELESDPGLFTLLVEDLGVSGVQVDEIYDLSKSPADPVFGFIFLFRWQQNNEKKNSRRSSRAGGSLNTSQASSAGGADFSPIVTPNSKTRATDDHSLMTPQNPSSVPPEEVIFFAQQVVPNSCATHSLLSILMNTKAHQGVDLGPLLTEFRRATTHVSPRVRGLAIGYMPPLVEAHNRHARQPNPPKKAAPSEIVNEMSGKEMPPVECVQTAVEAAKKVVESETQLESSATSTAMVASSIAAAENDTFHFVCFLPVGKFLFELDGLKKGPVNHGPLDDPVTHVGWTQQCLNLLQQRMKDQDLRYNLMAVVPDRRLVLSSRLDKLNKNRSILAKTIQQLTSSNATAVEIKLDQQQHPEQQPDSTVVPVASGDHWQQQSAVKLEENVTIGPAGANHATPEECSVKMEEYAQEVDGDIVAGEEIPPRICEQEHLSAEPSDTSGDVDGRPLTRAATRAATASRASSHKYPSPSSASSSINRQSLSAPPSSICIDLTDNEMARPAPPTTSTLVNTPDFSSTEAKAESFGVTTRRRATRDLSDSEQQQSSQRQSKYPTRSSTRRDTLASHALANIRYTPTQQRPSSQTANPSPDSHPIEQKHHPMTTAFLTTDDLQHLLEGIDAQAKACSAALAEEESKRHTYRVDSARRTHDYEPFIRAFLTELAKHDLLQQLLEEEAAVEPTPRQLRKRRSETPMSKSVSATTTTTPQKKGWSGGHSSSTISTSSSSTNSTPSKKTPMTKQSHGEGMTSRAVLRKARMTAAGADARSRRKQIHKKTNANVQQTSQRPATRLLSSSRRSSS